MWEKIMPDSEQPPQFMHGEDDFLNCLPHLRHASHAPSSPQQSSKMRIFIMLYTQDIQYFLWHTGCYAIDVVCKQACKTNGKQLVVLIRTKNRTVD
jgi:hypothetical protein